MTFRNNSEGSLPMKTLTLVPIGGLANRMYAVTSAIAFCEDYQIRLKVIWFKDWGMGAGFHDLFKLSERVDRTKVDIIDAKWYHYIYDRPRKKNLWIPGLYQRMAFGRRMNDKEEFLVNEELLHTKDLYLVQYCPFYKERLTLSSIQPNPSIRRQIEERVKMFPQKTVGLHIRRSDNTLSIEKSPLSLFIEKMEEEIKANPDVSFYVASDSLDEKLELRQRFGNSVITTLDSVRRDTTDGIVDAMVELYALSCTSKIYGSHGSTFSILAGQISNVNYECCIKKEG